jgi:hypothetical protein
MIPVDNQILFSRRFLIIFHLFTRRPDHFVYHFFVHPMARIILAFTQPRQGLENGF